MKGYWDKNKQNMFPKIKDWTKPQNHIRRMNIHDQTHKQWFWFSSDSYKLIYYGNSIISMIMFISLAIYFSFRELYMLSLIPALFSLFFIRGTIMKIKDRKSIQDMTFYDLYLRDF